MLGLLARSGSVQPFIMRQTRHLHIYAFIYMYMPVSICRCFFSSIYRCRPYNLTKSSPAPGAERSGDLGVPVKRRVAEACDCVCSMRSFWSRLFDPDQRVSCFRINLSLFSHVSWPLDISVRSFPSPASATIEVTGACPWSEAEGAGVRLTDWFGGIVFYQTTLQKFLF